MATKAEREKATANRNKAMSHPLRARLLRILNDRVASPNEMAVQTGEKLTDVAYHVRVLEKYDCIENVDTKQRRGAVEHFYRATERHLIDTEDWEDLPIPAAELLVDEFTQRAIDDYAESQRLMREMVVDYGAGRSAGMVGTDKHFHITRTPLTLDTEGRDRVLEIEEEARLKILEEEKASALRMAESGEDPLVFSSTRALFRVPAPYRMKNP